MQVFRFMKGTGQTLSVGLRASEGCAVPGTGKLIEEYIEKLNHGQKLVALTGPAGSGKSTLMARLALKLQEKGKEVLPVFCVGISSWNSGKKEIIENSLEICVLECKTQFA